MDSAKHRLIEAKLATECYCVELRKLWADVSTYLGRLGYDGVKIRVYTGDTRDKAVGPVTLISGEVTCGYCKGSLILPTPEGRELAAALASVAP